MTNDELNGWTREVLAEKASKLAGEHLTTPWRGISDLMRLIAKHERPPVDPVLAAARELCAERNPSSASEFHSGEWDQSLVLLDIMAGIRRGLELAGAPHGAD